MNDLLSKLPVAKIVEHAKRFRFVIFLSIFALIYSFLFLSISQLDSQKPDRAAVEEELQTVKRLKVDEEAVEQMLKLTEENIEVNSLYEEARNNPFAE